MIVTGLSVPDERTLMEQAARTEVSPNHAFAELYRRHVDHVYRYLYARTGSVQDAQDLTAQTFLSALKKMASYRSESGFSAWVLAIARRKVADHYRRHYRQGIPLPLDEDDELIQDIPPPEEMVIERLQLERVLAVLQAIASERAEALSLHIFGELTIPEVAVIMEKTETAVRMLIHRALNDLRVRLVSQE
jgi:RNA polymerase sigma-70 factor (ECF subfamily)